MPEFLLFRLAAPLASWGDIAVGERRTTWPRPSRSAVLGLVGGALGLRRDDAAGLAALDAGVGFAVRVDGRALPVRDFHTAQAPPARRGARWPTRREELAERRLSTVVSERWYWSGAEALVALWARGGFALVPLADALERPVFAPYLGRKACPPSRPFAPRVLGADDIAAAMRAYDAADPGSAPDAVGHQLWADLDAAGADAAPETQVRRDTPVSRTAWTFTERREARMPFTAGAPSCS